jgi:hypothetical protein
MCPLTVWRLAAPDRCGIFDVAPNGRAAEADCYGGSLPIETTAVRFSKSKVSTM